MTLVEKTQTEDLLATFLKDLAGLELAVEALKCKLALRVDFELEDLFRFFNLSNENALNKETIKEVANQLGV